MLLNVLNGNKSKLVCPPPCAATSGRDTRGPSPCLWSKILSGRDPKHYQRTRPAFKTQDTQLQIKIANKQSSKAAETSTTTVEETRI